ncbi:MAG TPA: hypothetical protein PLB02_07870 [Thermoanaerobaculia bacterium]|nr:hypothetical protein [Thermoanaerobaculia bacterium]HQR67293.1 hypothetical protein [Thermoanaerobaculia bacterium]
MTETETDLLLADGAALTGTPPWSLTWSDGVTQSGLLTSPSPAPVVTTAWVRVPTNGWTVSVPPVAGRSWTWSVSSNGTIASGQGTNSIFVTRAASGAIDISVVETVTATGCSGTGTARIGGVRSPY